MSDIPLLPQLESSNNVQEAAGLKVPSNEPTIKELSAWRELKFIHVTVGTWTNSFARHASPTTHIGSNLFRLPSGTIATPTVHTH